MYRKPDIMILGGVEMAKTVSEVLRETINGSGESLYRVAKATGLPYAVVYDFARGNGGINSATLDVLCEFYDLRLVGRRQRRRPRRDR